MPATESVRTNDRNMRKIATSAAKKAVQEAEELGLDDGEEIEGTNVDNQTDIFVGPAQDLIRAGDFPKFTIYKNGEMIVTKGHPYSWEAIQKEYGGGSFRVQLKSGNKGTIAKTETKQLADPARVDFEFEDEGHQEQIPSSGKSNELMQHYILKNDMDEKNRQRREEREDKMRLREQEIQARLESKEKELDAKIREIEAKKESSSTEMFKMMMAMQQESSKQMQTQAIETQKLITSIQAESQKLMLTMLTNKKDDGALKPHELAKMLVDAEKHGYERMKYINEQIEKGAEARAQEIAEGKEDGDDSIVKTVIKGFMPLVAQALSNPQVMAQARQATMTPEQMEHQRRLQENQRVQLENRKIDMQNKKRAEIERRKAGGKGPALVPNPNDVTQSNPVAVPSEIIPPSHANGAVHDLKDKIRAMVVPLIGQALSVGADPRECGDICLQRLLENGIGLKQVLENFTLTDIMSLAEEYKLPEEATPWLKGFYEHISSRGAGNSVAPVVGLQQ